MDTKHTATAINGQNPTTWDFLRAKGEFSYPTEDVNVYAKILSQMNLGDLQAHAMDKGIKPSSNRRQLESVLVNNFRSIMGRRKANKLNRKKTAEEIKQLEEKRQKSIERNGFLRTV